MDQAEQRFEPKARVFARAFLTQVSKLDRTPNASPNPGFLKRNTTSATAARTNMIAMKIEYKIWVKDTVTTSLSPTTSTFWTAALIANPLRSSFDV